MPLSATPWKKPVWNLPTADRKTLIRRLSYDLLGLAPDPEDVEAFVSDARPHAWRALVIAGWHLLIWGSAGAALARHRSFGESNGFEYNQPRNHAWRYRHWVVQALNADMAYDAFARMQLAGDVFSREPSGVIATGFWSLGAQYHQAIERWHAPDDATGRDGRYGGPGEPDLSRDDHRIVLAVTITNLTLSQAGTTTAWLLVWLGWSSESGYCLLAQRVHQGRKKPGQ